MSHRLGHFDLKLFGSRLKRLRTRRGLSQEELCRIAGISRPTICSVENGSRGCTLEVAVAIAAALGVDLGALIRPPVCQHYDGMPPAGFVCPDCGVTG